MKQSSYKIEGTRLPRIGKTYSGSSGTLSTWVPCSSRNTCVRILPTIVFPGLALSSQTYHHVSV